MLRSVVLIVLSIPATVWASPPGWFRGESSDLYGVFAAARRLSTPDASLAVEAGWGTIGGVLRDQKGRPIADCPLAISYGGPPGWDFSVWLQTDAEGRFVLYGTAARPKTEREESDEKDRSVDEGDIEILGVTSCGPKGFRFRAAPGYPTSSLGRRFAYEKKAWCDCQVVSVSDVTSEWFFCELSCDGEGSFDKGAFEAFVREDAARPIRFKRDMPHRQELQSRNERGDGIEKKYPIRVVGAGSKPVEDARVLFRASDGRAANYLTVATDADGQAVLTERLSKAGEHGVKGEIRRFISIDVKGGPVGPVDCDLVEDQVNVIRVPEPATVRGRVVDWHGNPLSVKSFDGIRYEKSRMHGFELELSHGGGGQLEFSRVMPGQPFRVFYSPAGHFHASPCHSVTNQLLSGASDSITLEPGEVRDGVELIVRPAAAIRGVVVDDQGREAPAETVIRLLRKGQEWGPHVGANGIIHASPEPPSGPRFGLFGLGAEPVRIRVDADGFETKITEPLVLSPGEMRFVTINMSKK